MGDVGDSTNESAVSTTNGLRLLNGLTSTNGIRLTNGLRLLNGLTSTNGIMTTDAGRTQLAYVVRCALNAGTTIVQPDQYGTNHTFTGVLGLAPEWENGSCGQTCQEYVSACLLAHVNTTGIHVPIWMVSQHPVVGWGQDPDFTNQEATFFGNVFTPGAHGTDPTTTPQYYCTGPQWNVSPPAGRIGSTAPPPFIDPFGTHAACLNNCAAADYPHQGDGFKACYGWNNTVSIWRRPANAITATGTINVTSNTANGPITIPSPRQTTWHAGYGFRNMDK
jgi:hypothetical protein